MVPKDAANELDVRELTRVIEDFAGIFIRLPSVEKFSFTTLSVLHTLSRAGKPLRLSELTATEQVTQPAMTQIVTRLEGDGFVERRPDPHDGRAVLVHMTRRGTAVVDARHSDRVANLGELVDALPARERKAIAAALPALKHVIQLRHKS